MYFSAFPKKELVYKLKLLEGINMIFYSPDCGIKYET